MVMDSDRLIKAKVQRVGREGDDSAADLLMIVLCSDGLVPPFWYGTTFHHYNERYGKEKFEDTKQSLAREGILTETQEGLWLNHPDRKSASKECGDLLFQERLEHYGSLVSEIMATAEGSYFLTELAKVGPYVGEEDLSHIAKAVGGAYYSQIYEKLTKNCLLIWQFSSRKHDYFKLLPQIKSLVVLESPVLRDALAFIYIGERVRSEGILQSDCSRFLQQTGLLKALCLVQESHWYSHDLFVTTERGRELATSIVKERLELNRQELTKFLDSAPAKVVQYFVEDIIPGGAGDNPLALHPEDPGKSDMFTEVKHHCLLNERRILEWRDKILEELQKVGLAVLAYNYVATRGGELREVGYCIALEADKFLREYVQSKQPSSMFDKEQEIGHILYHAFSGSLHRDVLESELLKHGVNMVKAEATIQEMVEKRIIKTENGMITVVDKSGCHRFLREKFLEPLVNALFEKPEPGPLLELEARLVQVEPQQIEPPEAPMFPFEITFPPYENGKAIVFGRGFLKDKIAWGFEAGKDLTEATIVTSDLYDINQPHVGSFQQTRTGKSTLASCVALQVAFQGVPVVIIDPKPDYVSGLIPVSRTISRFPDHREAIEKRILEAKQDPRGFDFTRDVVFKQDGKGRKIQFRIYSFNKNLQRLPNCRVLKLPLIVLPPLHDPDFEDQCNATATSLVNCLPIRKGKALNTLLAEVMKRYKKENPDQELMLKVDVEQELQQYLTDADREERKRIKTLVDGLNEYYTGNSYLYAANEAEVVRIDSVVMNPEYEDGDKQTVSIAVIDVSALPQEKRNPVLQNYVSQVCGQLYNLVKRKRTEKAVQLFIVFDEAQNYLPEPSDQYNYARVIINRGASLGIKAWLMAQSPQAVEKEARKQFTTLVLSMVNEASVRDEVSKYVQSDSWTDKLKHTELGKALIVNSETGKEGGKLCVTFTTPQTVNILSTEQVTKFLGQG